MGRGRHCIYKADEECKTLIKNIEYILTFKNMRKPQLCEMLGTNKNYFSAVTRGLNAPSMSMLFKICYALNATPDELFGFRDIKFFKDKEIASDGAGKECETFIRNVEKTLIVKNMRKPQLCEMVGVNISYFSLVKYGRHDLSVGAMLKICYALNVTPDELFGFREINISKDKEVVADLARNNLTDNDEPFELKDVNIEWELHRDTQNVRLFISANGSKPVYVDKNDIIPAVERMLARDVMELGEAVMHERFREVDKTMALGDIVFNSLYGDAAQMYVAIPVDKLVVEDLLRYAKTDYAKFIEERKED